MLHQELSRLQAEGKPIRVGASGAGWLGSGFVAQVAHVPGMTVSVLADEDVSAAWQALIATGIDREQIVEATAPGAAMDAVGRQRGGVCLGDGVVGVFRVGFALYAARNGHLETVGARS